MVMLSYDVLEVWNTNTLQKMMETVIMVALKVVVQWMFAAVLLWYYEGLLHRNTFKFHGEGNHNIKAFAWSKL